MFRRDLIKLGGTTFVLITAGSTEVLAEKAEQRDRAKELIAAKHGLEKSNLEIHNEAVASWDSIDEHYYQPKVYDTENRHNYRILLDGDGNEVSREDLNNREENAYQNQYGKYSPQLKEEVENADSKEEFSIVVWLNQNTVPWQQIEENATRAAERNGANTRGGRGKDFSELRKELSDRRVNQVGNATEKVANRVADIETVSIKEVRSGCTSFRATAKEKGLEQIQDDPDVWRIFKHRTQIANGLNEASQTHQTFDDRNSTLNADGTPLGHLEQERPLSDAQVDFHGTNWTFGYDDEDPTEHAHSTRTVECAASTVDLVPGAAHDANVYSADNWENEWDSKTAWLDQQDVPSITMSEYHYPVDSRILREMDLTVEQTSFNRNLTFTILAGNEGDELDYVVSPGRAFNIITVGGIHDQDTGNDRSDDIIYPRSSTLNPYSKNRSSDGEDFPHDKPEVAAVAQPIATPNSPTPREGTSYSAPQVTGFCSLIEKHTAAEIHRSPDLAKAITMASATHHVGSYEERGTGCIDADSMLDITNNIRWISDRFDQSNSTQEYSIDLEAGDEIKIVLVWNSNANQGEWELLQNAQSDINLNLYFYDPSGTLDKAGVGYDRNWQYIDDYSDYVSIDSTGTWELSVYADRWDAPESRRAFSIAWHIR